MSVYWKLYRCLEVVLLNTHIDVGLWFYCFIVEPTFLFCCCLFSLSTFLNECQWCNTCQLSQNDDVGNINNFNWCNVKDILLGYVGSIRWPPSVGNLVFHVSSTMLQLLQIKGLFDGLPYEYYHDHIRNFVDICVLSYSRIHPMSRFNSCSSHSHWWERIPSSYPIFGILNNNLGLAYCGILREILSCLKDNVIEGQFPRF